VGAQVSHPHPLCLLVTSRCVLDVRRLWQPIFSDRIVGSSAIVCEVAHLPSDFLMTGCAGMWPGSVLMAFCARSLSAGSKPPNRLVRVRLLPLLKVDVWPIGVELFLFRITLPRLVRLVSEKANPSVGADRR
jgi:hypothetical protein